MTRGVAVLAVLAALGGAGQAQAQAQAALQSGQARGGTMPAEGPGLATCYTFRTFGVDVIEAIVRSEAFDPMVEIAPGSDCLARDGWRDDDGGAASGGPRDARLVTERQPAGDYVIRVRRADGRSGPFQVMAMSGSIHFTGSTALNSPTLAGSRNWQAEAREAARAEVATDVYAPPPRPSGYDGVSDGDLMKRLSDSIGDGPDSTERIRRMDPVARAWMTYHSRLLVREYLAGVNTWRDANPTTEELARRRAAQARAEAQARADAAAQAQAQARTRAQAAAAPPALRPGCRADGTCTYAVVSHMGGQTDPYMPSYEGTLPMWGIMVTGQPTPRHTIPFTICGIQVYAASSDERDIRGRMNPTSEAYARRFSLSPYGGGAAICAWSPPRYTGPNR